MIRVGEYQWVRPSEVVAVESDDRWVRVHLQSGKEVVAIYSTITAAKADAVRIAGENT